MNHHWVFISYEPKRRGGAWHRALVVGPGAVVAPERPDTVTCRFCRGS